MIGECCWLYFQGFSLAAYFAGYPVFSITGYPVFSITGYPVHPYPLHTTQYVEGCMSLWYYFGIRRFCQWSRESCEGIQTSA